jgi:hypothetical protein
MADLEPNLISFLNLVTLHGPSIGRCCCIAWIYISDLAHKTMALFSSPWSENVRQSINL